MKKNLLALFALSAMYSASAQTAYIKDKAVVAVKANTLFYMGNGLDVKSSNPRTIINDGNIQINLSNVTPGYTVGTTETSAYSFTNYETNGSTVNNGSNFVNTWTAKDNYGQVMFTTNGLTEGAPNRINGNMTFERPYVSTSSYNWLPISLPFDVSTADAGTIGSILSNSFDTTPSDYVYNDSRSNARYSSTAMIWSIFGYYYQAIDKDTEVNSIPGSAANTYILNLTKGKLKSIYDSHNTTTDRVAFRGSPYARTINHTILNTAKNVIKGVPWTNFFSNTDKWGNWKMKINDANEYYKSYIGESFELMDDQSTTYGKYLLNFGNPFTHNFDLAQFFSSDTGSDDFKRDVKAVQKVGSSVTWNIKDGNTTPIQTTLKASVPTNPGTGFNPSIMSKAWTGDKEALILRPFEVVAIKFDYTNASDKTGNEKAYQLFNIDNSYIWPTTPKTFNQQSSATTTAAPPIIPKGITNTKQNDENKISVNNNPLYQLGLAVSNADETQGNRIYFVAVDGDVTGNKNGFELEYGDYGSNSGFWLNQENKDETFDAGSYLFINGFNMNDYVGKPLHMTFYKNPKDANTKFTLTANLAEGSTLNDGLDNFSNGNKFYFVDNKENKAIEITKDFKYTFTANEDSNDRFVVYWNALPKTLGTDDVQVNKNKTFIYKNSNSSNSIRFAKKNLMATVEIFNMNGQLISSKNDINTSQDYSINNIENGIYVVQIKYSDNTVETLKSIFKK